MKTDRIVLPIAKNNLITTWSSTNHLFAILLNNTNSYEWILNTYVNIYGFTYKRENVVYAPNFHYTCLSYPNSAHYPGNAWDSCPFISKHSVDRSTIKRKYDSVVDFLYECTANNYYVCTETKNLFSDDGVHTSLVFGMDPEQKKVSVCDHFYQGKYGEKLINYSAYEKAYQEVDDLLRNGYFEKSQVKNRAHEVDYVYYIKPINGHYAFNIELFKYDLTSYLNSDNNIGFMGKKDNFYSSYSDCAYGLDTYNLLIDYLNNLSEGKIEFEDYRSFTFLKEHKTLMQKRLVYLYDKGYLSCDSTVTRWAEICDAFTLIQDLFIKYTITDNQETLKKILALIYDTRRVEKEVLKALCLTLEKTGNAQVI